ncbi:hypothetical protein N7466_001163 [Penicillium verhagenii]|uniref:uncharacterized protein n=1 Tax=Penicillium verhagenii TaxID=1562060 RepID=UPI00254583FD|nr:uncharacterized protein N7466_001163 [Penicillium verhagenii]KAJ5948148.1 hypothetical protein N7466_001163 [Penicillium verhagenii]
MHIILTGATGLVGSGVLHAMIQNSAISKISVLSRRPVPMLQEIKDDRINVVLAEDFTKFDNKVLDQLNGATGCVWAMGVSQNDVNKEDYTRITKTMTLYAAQAFKSLASPSETFKFVYVSGEGATHEPGFTTPIFGRVKGETEIALAKIEEESPRFQAISVRPAMVDSGAHDEIKPWVPQLGAFKRVTYAGLSPVIRCFWPGMHSPTKPLGAFLTGVATGEFDGKLTGSGVDMVGNSPIINNIAFRRLMALDTSKK